MNSIDTPPEKKVAIIQSNYIPWKGYFDLINYADEFVFYDHVQYTKNDWRNRNLIKTKSGTNWITIPVRVESMGQLIKDTKIADERWKKKHWKSIAQAYSKAKFFMDWKEYFEELYMKMDEKYLSKINYKFIVAINQCLKINTKLSYPSDFSLKKERTERLIDICKTTKATTYISGPAAKNYIDEQLFHEEGIDILWMDYSGYPEYHQLYPPFDQNVSIIDLIFNEGPDAQKYMKSF